MAYVSTVIAILGFVVSVVALFFSQLRAPRLSCVVGPQIQIYYPFDGGFGVYIPATFVNKSPRTGTVLRCGLSIYRKSAPEERFFMGWRFFMGLNPDLSFKFEEGAHALAIPGNSAVAKTVWLTWRYNSTPELVVTEGEYVLVLHCWFGANEMPDNYAHEFYIDRATQTLLDQYRAGKKSTVVDLLLDQKIAANKLLTSYESKSLLGP